MGSRKQSKGQIGLNKENRHQNKSSQRQKKQGQQSQRLASHELFNQALTSLRSTGSTSSAKRLKKQPVSSARPDQIKDYSRRRTPGSKLSKTRFAQKTIPHKHKKTVSNVPHSSNRYKSKGTFSDRKTSEFLRQEKKKRNQKKDKVQTLKEKQKKFEEEVRARNKSMIKRRDSTNEKPIFSRDRSSPAKQVVSKPQTRHEFRKMIGLSNLPDEVIEQKLKDDRK